MSLTETVVKFVFVKFFQVLWTSVIIGKLAISRILRGSTYFEKRIHPKPKCLEGWDDRYVQTSSVKLHYVQTGKDDAPLLVMVHGFPEFWYSWRFQLNYFKDRYRCVAIDMRGYNLSEKPEGIANYDIDLLARDVKDVIEKLGYKKAFLMAHDWGAAVAWKTAINFPEVIEKLIICNVPHPVAFASGGIEQLFKSWYIFMFQTPYIPELLIRSGDFEMLDSIFRDNSQGIKNKENVNEEDIEAWKHVFSQDGALTPPINFYRSAVRRGPLKASESIVEPPTLIVWGTGDAYLALSGALKSLDYCKDGRIKLIEGASHWVMQDEPEKVNKYVEEFLSS